MDDLTPSGTAPSHREPQGPLTQGDGAWDAATSSPAPGAHGGTAPFESGPSSWARKNPSRKHMGVASSDPSYLPPVENAPRGSSAHHPPHGAGEDHLDPLATGEPAAHQRRRATRPMDDQHRGAQPSQLHYDRYISAPKRGKAIFTSRQDRQRRRMRTVLALLILASIALALVWVFVLR